MIVRSLCILLLVICANFAVQAQEPEAEPLGAPVEPTPEAGPVDTAPFAPVSPPFNATPTAVPIAAPSNFTVPFNSTYPPFTDPSIQTAIDAGYIGGFLGLNVLLIVGMIILVKIFKKRLDIPDMEARSLRRD